MFGREREAPRRDRYLVTGGRKEGKKNSFTFFVILYNSSASSRRNIRIGIERRKVLFHPFAYSDDIVKAKKEKNLFSSDDGRLIVLETKQQEKYQNFVFSAPFILQLGLETR